MLMYMFNVTSTCFGEDDPYPFQHFAPSLAQCFLIVIIGYLVARFELLSSADQRGVNAFVVYIGMPSIICVTLADADFSDLRWELLLGLFIGKAVVFAVVAVVSLVISRNVGVAGLLAVFCVQTNDLPVGNPLMTALYKDYRPQMLKYLFLMPAMTMIFFVPIGTLMIEMHKTKKDMKKVEKEPDNKGQWQRFLKSKEVISLSRSLVKSTPVIISSVLGITLNMCLKNGMPLELHQSFKVLAATVPGCVLSVLGFSMVRKERYLLTSAVVTATALMTVKMFVTPIVTHAITRFLSDDSPSSKLLSDFGLLYGIVSPATSIFLAGQEFRKPLAAMSATLIVSSFLSFPTSFFVARFTIAPLCEWTFYRPSIIKLLFGVSGLSLLCDVFVFSTIVLKKKWRIVPYNYVTGLVFTQILTSIGVLVGKSGLEGHFQLALYYGGEISGLIWMTITALVFLSAIRHPTLPSKKFDLISIITFTACILFTALMCFLVDIKNMHQVFVIGSPETAFEFLQIAAATFLQVLCLGALCASLLYYFRNTPDIAKQNDEYDGPVYYIEIGDVTTTQYKRNRNQSAFSVLNFQEEEAFYQQEVMRHSNDVQVQWPFKFFSLYLLLAISVFVRFVSNVYKLIDSQSFEVTIPLEFLQSTLYFSQGFYIFITFGIDLRSICIRIINWYRKIRYGQENFILRNTDNDTNKENHFRDLFYTFYFEKCYRQLSKNRKWKDAVYMDSFWGHQLVDWMIQEGLAEDDTEAEELGQKLVEGNVLQHVTGSHLFHDAPYLYYFIPREEHKME